MTDDDLLELTDRAQAVHFWFHGFRDFVRPALAVAAGGRTDLRLLDCGCGTGHNLPLLRPFGSVMAFDRTESGVVRAKARGRLLARADIAHMPFASGSVDIATCFDVLQCIEPDVEAMFEMARVVRPGGAVVLTVAALDALQGDHSLAWREPRRYNRRSITRIVEQAGLRVERVSYLFGSLVPLMLGLRLTQRVLRHRRTHQIESDLVVPPAPINRALTALVRGEAAMAPYIPMPFGSSLLVVARKNSRNAS